MAPPDPSSAEADEEFVGPPIEEVTLISNAIATAAAPDSGLSQLQETVLAAQTEAMTGHRYNRSWRSAVSPSELAAGIPERDRIFRIRVFQMMTLVALVVHPTPPEIGQRLRRFAEALDVGSDILNHLDAHGAHAYDAAIADFARNGYAGDFAAQSRPSLSTDRGIGDGWATVDDDPVLAATWKALGNCPDSSLGRGVHDLYRSRRFAFPGQPGSAPPLLAQHDWVHVLADYGTTLQNEIEVFGFISRADDDPRAFSLLAMVISLFETGMLSTGAGLFQADTGHLSAEGMATRLADAMRRGAMARPDGDTPKSFLAIDWLDYADTPIEEVRRRFKIPPKSANAIAAGSVGPWHPDGLSDYQRKHGDLAILGRYTPS